MLLLFLCERVWKAAKRGLEGFSNKRSFHPEGSFRVWESRCCQNQDSENYKKCITENGNNILINFIVVQFSSVAQSCPTLCYPMDCSLSGFSIHGIFQARVHPGLVSFRMHWLDLLAVQGTCKSLLQHHSSKASILRCSAFFTVQLSHPYMTTGKNHMYP